MSIQRYFAALRLNCSIQLRNLWMQAVIIVIPLIMIPFMLPACKDSLRAQGHLQANGSEQALPGFAILFSMFSLQMVLQLFYNEHSWHTWDRLRMSTTSLFNTVMAKLSVAFLIQVVQVAVVMLVGAAIFHYRPNGSILALTAVCLLICLTLTLFGFLNYIYSSTEEMAMSFNNILGMLLAGIGGALSPVSGFPSWAQNLAKISPIYWAMNAIDSINFQRAGLADVGSNLGVLLGFIVALIALTAVLFKRGLKHKEA
ncbi:hypothetical protein KIM372_07520 [Bombiscardovia nodaiensis]|uniref:ABC transmembrane type-2 domain-containing protein n=1 Tax=Bombiscardovia nodaiensis TaxID=2932181 RepID=A0ABN6S9H6_9BIFI|nr:hypothetical protein KIM372_07520 [Bombiscardovia nodaiensis]